VKVDKKTENYTGLFFYLFFRVRPPQKNGLNASLKLCMAEEPTAVYTIFYRKIIIHQSIFVFQAIRPTNQETRKQKENADKQISK